MTTEAAVIVYHANARSLYKERWLNEFVASIHAQTVTCDVYELDYGETPEGPLFNFPAQYFETHLPTHAHAQNYLLDKVLGEQGYRYAFNTNVDDYYSLMRNESQLLLLRQGYDIVSSNWFVVNEEDAVERQTSFSTAELFPAMSAGHNIMCHPSIAYSQNFWFNSSKYRPEEIPEEDLQLWQRELQHHLFCIDPAPLCYHRRHVNSICERIK